MASTSLRQRHPPSRPTSNGSPTKRSVARAVVATSASEWLAILALIFGGCCSNAYTLELATRQLPSSGTLITFAQFLVTTLSALPHFIQRSERAPWMELKPRVVPLYRWGVQVALYLSSSLLNNTAFAYNVPMSVHIVFRSGGLVINMVLGYAVQKTRYSLAQVASVLLVTAGVVASTFSSQSGPSTSKQERGEVGEYATGVALLFAALVITGLMGLWQERTFRLYGNQNWRESMFYSHLLSLPLFALRSRALATDIAAANNTTPWYFGTHHPHPTRRSDWAALLKPPALDLTPARVFALDHLIPALPAGWGKGVWVPSFWPPLVLNVATQLLCINGVNRLTAQVSSLSVTLVLVVRKALSLLVSVLLVQRSTGTPALWTGAAAVLAGTITYSLSKPPPSAKKTL